MQIGKQMSDDSVTSGHAIVRCALIPASRRWSMQRTLPQVTRVVTDSDGRAWLRRWARYGAPSAEWIVLERFGAPIARVSMPAAFVPNEVGADYLLGMITDEDGVQSIHRYVLSRPKGRNH